MRTRVGFWLALLGGFLSQLASLHAAEPTDAVGSLIGEEAVWVTRVNLARLEPLPLAEFLTVETPKSSRLAEQLTDDARQLTQLRDDLRKQGVREIFIVVDLAGSVSSDMVFLLIPLPAPAPSSPDSAAAVVKLMQPKDPQDPPGRLALLPADLRASAVIGGTLVLASAEKLEAIRKREKNAPSTQFASLRARCGDATVSLMLLLSDDQRRVIKEMKPSLPAPLASFPLSSFLQTFRGATCNLDFPPKIAASLHIDFESPEAARDAAPHLKTLLRSVLSLAARQQPDLDVDKFAAELEPKVTGKLVVLQLAEKGAITNYAMTTARRLLFSQEGSAYATKRKNSLKQLGLAMHNFHDASKAFPPRVSVDRSGKPLLSWRVALLPYLDQGKLYQEFRQNEPWDSAHNRKLIPRMPALFAPGERRLQAEGKTRFQVPVGAGTIFDRAEATHIRDVTDGTSNTILVVETERDKAVIWTKPDDWQVDPKNPLAGLIHAADKKFLILLCDGSVRYVNATINPKTLRSLLTMAGGEVVDEF